MITAIVLRYGELFLKGRNRGFFEDRLVAGARRAIARFPGVSCEKLHGRVWVARDDGAAFEDPLGRQDLPLWRGEVAGRAETDHA